jgi:AraC-like DNA-binding protein
MTNIHCIPPYIAIALVEWGKTQGLTDDAMAQALALPCLDELRAEDCRLSADDYERLLTLLYQQSGQPHLGLLVGLTLSVSSYGVLGHAMLSGATVKEAITLGLEFYRLTSSFMTLSSQDNGNVFSVIGQADYHLPALSRFAPEELLVGFTNVSRQLLGDDFSPVAIYFSSPQPDYLDELQAFFRCPLFFQHPYCRFDLAQSVLPLPLKTANALTASQLIRLCQSLLAQDDSSPAKANDLLTSIQGVIKAKPGYWPSMSEVAKVLALSERTLRRRLQDLGTDYQQQLDNTRQQLARQLVTNPQVTVEQLAAVLGYSEAASFRRAFHRWFAMSPQMYRQQGA